MPSHTYLEVSPNYNGTHTGEVGFGVKIYFIELIERKEFYLQDVVYAADASGDAAQIPNE